MNKLVLQIQKMAAQAIGDLYGACPVLESIQVSPTDAHFEGDYTLMVFPFVKISKLSPEATGAAIGHFLQEQCKKNTPENPFIERFNVVKGFLNLVLTDAVWLRVLKEIGADKQHGNLPISGKKIVVEYCSPNTNKPLHLGHVRNMLLGWSVSAILEKAGHEVHKVLIYNDRGVHICKSMVAWQHYANGATPQSTGKKSDLLVGDYYVKFDEIHRQQKAELIANGMVEKEAEQQTPIFKEVQEMLRQWENGNEQVRQIWKMMNDWVYEGHNVTYKTIGVDFEKRYYESETYLQGKRMVQEGLAKGVFYAKENGAIAVDLTDQKLDEKILARADGTSIYITQDLAAADIRYTDYQMDKSVYVVGNEQDYHFKVLKAIMQKLGYPFADDIFHLSYGMVDLPSGKMKSREGTVVDADELIAEMVELAQQHTDELGKTDGMNPTEAENLYRMLALGALKFFILKVSPQKRMVFDPNESIDFLGHTGPFIQYSHARIKSVLRKYGKPPVFDVCRKQLLPSEKKLILKLNQYPLAVAEAAQQYAPSKIANYAYELAQAFNTFYGEAPILNNAEQSLNDFRVMLSFSVGRTLASAMNLLGIEMPDRM